MPVTRRTVHLQKLATGPSLGWIAEGAQKPATTITFDRDTAVVKELAGILKWSDRLEAESFASPGIRRLVLSALEEAASATIDQALWNAVPTTDDPDTLTGLLQVAGLPAVSYGTGADLGEDIRLAIRAVKIANYQPTAVAMHSAALDRLMSIRAGATDQLKYPEVLSGRIWGLPIVVSNGIPIGDANTDGEVETNVVVADWSKILCCVMPMSVLISNVAYADGESAFETDKTFVRYVANISSPVVRRTSAVCKVTSVLA